MNSLYGVVVAVTAVELVVVVAVAVVAAVAVSANMQVMSQENLMSTLHRCLVSRNTLYTLLMCAFHRHVYTCTCTCTFIHITWHFQINKSITS